MVARASNCLEQTRCNFLGGANGGTRQAAKKQKRRVGLVAGSAGNSYGVGRSDPQMRRCSALLNPADQEAEHSTENRPGKPKSGLLTVIGQKGIGLIEGFAFTLGFGAGGFLFGLFTRGYVAGAHIALGNVKEGLAQLDLCARFVVFVRFHKCEW